MELILKNGKHVINPALTPYTGIVPRDLNEGDTFEEEENGKRVTRKVTKKIKVNGLTIVYSS